MQQILSDISTALQNGRAKVVKELVTTALEQNFSAQEILGAMLDGMSIVGAKFKADEIFVPEVLISARALNQGLEIIKPILTETGVKPIGKAVIGTIKGDLHDIGKNLVKMMLIGSGLEVIDLGVDVSPETFVQSAQDNGAKLICISALLTTTMTNMKGVIDELNARGIRDQYIVMIGGAPITTAFAEEIGADRYTPDAATAAEVAKGFFE